MRRTLSLAATIAAILSFAIAGPVGAIRFGSADAGEHPYVGELLFYVPDANDPRFNDPGGWFDCSATLLDATHVVTAGHCTFAVGLNGASTTHDGKDTTAAQGGVGGNDIWISFAAAPDFSILPPSVGFVPDRNAERYAAWRDALNGSAEWHRGTATPHPLYDDNLFFVHDAGVVTLSSPVPMSKYGQVAPLNWLDQYAGKPKRHVFETVGYGLEKITPSKEVGGDTRRKANPELFSLASSPPNTYMVLTANAATGGTCFGDSGGPSFDNTNSNLVVSVTSFAVSKNCAGGKGGVYRLDEPDDLAFLATFGIHP